MPILPTVQVEVLPVKDECEAVVLFLCIYKDITAQKVLHTVATLSAHILQEDTATNIFSGLSKFAKIAWSLNKLILFHKTNYS